MEPMKRAITLARRAIGASSPNPAVGALVMADGIISGEGWTQPPGGHHAEKVALANAGARALGGILYTTLEPCCTQGRTPPCTEAIIRSGISEVHIAAIDPNPTVNGRGMANLIEAGIQVKLGENEPEYKKLLEAYFKWISSNLPFVTAKYAMSLDGKIATDSGESRWITGNRARRYVHKLRRESDAIMVGIGTATKDNPRLTARNVQGRPRAHQPLRVVVDSLGVLDPTALLLQEPGETLVATATINQERKKLLKNSGAEVLVIPGKDNHVDLVGLVKELGRREVTNILVEGGGNLLAAMIQMQLIDKIMAFIAPIIIGGKNSPTPVEGESVTKLIQSLKVENWITKRVGEDLLVAGYLTKKG